jgi:tetratricopeptide (TPR) repeat protein
MGDDSLQQGIKLAREGKRQEAYQLLSEYVQRDPHNEQAWLWLSGVVDKPEYTRACLERVLAINPQNTQAQQGLQWLASQKPAAPSPAPAPQPVAAPKPAASLRNTREIMDPLAPSNEPKRSSTQTSSAQGTTSAYRMSEIMDPLAPSSRSSSPPKPAEPAPAEVARPQVATSEVLPQGEQAPASRRIVFPTDVPAEPASATTSSEVLPQGQATPTSRRISLGTPSLASAGTQQTSSFASSADGAPCVYCGQPNGILATNCAACKKSLLLRPLEKGKFKLSTIILTVIWALLVLVFALTTLLGLWEQYALTQTGAIDRGQYGARVLGAIASILVLALIPQGLFLRQRRGYVLHSIGLFSLLGMWVFMTIVMMTVNSLFQTNPGPNPINQSMFFLIIGVSALVLMVMIICSIFAFRDFFPKKLRYQPSVVEGDYHAHIAKAAAYEKRKMTYMALQEREAALEQRADSANLLEAMALGYSELNQIPRAKELIAQAISLAPKNKKLLKIQESLNAR